MSGQIHSPAAIPTGESPQCQINRELRGPHCRSGLSKHRETVRPAGNQTFFGLPVRRVVIVPPDLSRLSVRARAYVNMQNGSFDCSMPEYTNVSLIAGAVSGRLHCIPCRHLTHDAPTSWLIMGCRYPTRQGLVILFQVT